MARDDPERGTVIVAFVLGAVTGAAVALLMAPATGEETRRMLGERAREGRERAEEAARQGRELWNRQRETIATAFERGKRSLRAGARQPSRRAPRQGRGCERLERPVPRRDCAGDARSMASIQIGAIVFAGAPGPSGAAARRDRPERHPSAHRPRQSHCRRGVEDRRLATAQAQKIDRLMTDVSRRVDETSASSSTPSSPRPVKGWRSWPPSRPAWAPSARCVTARGRAGAVEDEDALFIG